MAKFSVSKLHSQLLQFFPDLKPIKALDLRNYFSGLLDSYLPIFQFRTVKNNLEATDELAIGDANKISFLELQKNMGKLVAKTGSSYDITNEDHGKIFYSGGNDDLTVSVPGTVPIGFEFGVLRKNGDDNIITVGGSSYGFSGLYSSFKYVKNIALPGTHFLYIKKTEDGILLITKKSGIWNGSFGSLDKFYPVITDGKKGGAIVTTVNSDITKDFGADFDNYQMGFDRLYEIVANNSFSLSNAGLVWTGAIGRAIVRGNEAGGITVTLTGLRAKGIEETHDIAEDEVFYFEAIRAKQNDDIFWVKAGESSSGSGGGFAEDVNRTGAAVVLDANAIYNDPDDPNTAVALSFSTVGAKNGITGVFYWQGNDWPEITINDSTKVVIKPFTFAAGAVYEIHYWFRKLSGKNRLTLIPEALNAPPQAQNVGLTGDAQVGKTITINASYFDPDGDVESSRDYRFVVADDDNGTNEAIIPGESGQNYTIDGAYLGMVIAPEVRMNAATGATPGEWVRGPWSSVITAASQIIKPDPGDYTVTEVGSNAVILSFGLQTGDTMVRFGDNGDKIAFDFNIAALGNFKIFARVRSGNTSEAQYENNYILKIDGVVRAHTLNLQKGIINSNDLGSSYFGWLEITSLVNLSAGNHTFEIEGKVTYAMFDKLEITPQ
ncbi:hypothetical protein [Flexithrix dorotheae]|uniref:hypothetical protein n=1 Tax=Flexithrix dorotheae TaxID=70993 RepID=UPI000373AB0B|nr:hypothetical protein [Flexithrix dorotheae]